MMKKTFFVLLMLSSYACAQTVSETPITSVSHVQRVSAYSFKYDKKTGTYVYSDYDTNLNATAVYSNKGNSAIYDNVLTYSVMFDDDGNYYTFSTNYNSDSLYIYFFLRNGQPVAEYEYVLNGWVLRNGIVYFAARENGLDHLFEYKTADGTISKGKGYDAIYLVYYPEAVYEGEPLGELGFTPGGKVYYLAELNGEKFIVAGGAELKHYSDIDYYSVTMDKKGVLTYVAKKKGKFYEQYGNTLVVQGDTEYREFDYVYGPILFNNLNVPVYISGDSVESHYPQRVMVGNKKLETFSGGVYDVKFTPSGKIAYVASEIYWQNVYKSFLVINGSRSKKYNYISNLSFLPGDVPFYVASFSDQNCAVMKGKERVSKAYSAILELRMLPGEKLFCIGSMYGDYEKKISDRNYVHIGRDVFGPYDYIPMIKNKTGSYIAYDSAGNYAFLYQKTIDFDNYIYSTVLKTNKMESKEFDFIDDVDLYNGTAYYTAHNYTDRGTFQYNFQLYAGETPVGDVYDDHTDYDFDRYAGKVSFIASKGNRFYMVEIKL